MVADALDTLAANGAPEALAVVALAHLGAERRVEALETGAGALERLRARLGGTDVAVVATPVELTNIKADG